MLVRIIDKTYKSAEGWGVGDVVDITNPHTLLAQGKVERVEEVEVAKPETVISEPVVSSEEAPLEDLSWNELRKLGKAEGLNLKGMNKKDIIEALK